MLEQTVFLTADRAVSVRVHKMKSTDEWVFAVFDFIIGVGDTKKKYSETAGHVWLHILQNNLYEPAIQFCPLVRFPGPLEDPRGSPCVSAYGLSVLYTHMQDHFGHRVKEEYIQEIDASIRAMLCNNVEPHVEMYDDGEIEAQEKEAVGQHFAGCKRKYSYLVDGVEMTETEIGAIRNDFVENINKMKEQHAAEMKRLVSELKTANEQIATFNFETKKTTGIRLAEILEDMKVVLKNPNHIRDLGSKVKAAFETEYDGKTFKKKDITYYFVEDKPLLEHLVQRELVLLDAESASLPETSLALEAPH